MPKRMDQTVYWAMDKYRRSILRRDIENLPAHIARKRLKLLSNPYDTANRKSLFYMEASLNMKRKALLKAKTATKHSTPEYRQKWEKHCHAWLADLKADHLCPVVIPEGTLLDAAQQRKRHAKWLKRKVISPPGTPAAPPKKGRKRTVSDVSDDIDKIFSNLPTKKKKKVSVDVNNVFNNLYN
jgi:hypothetical protein